MGRFRLPLNLFTIACLVLGGCSERPPPSVSGDSERGRVAIRAFGCGTCHVIPGIAGANGKVGPPLERIASRAYLAGVVANTPQGMQLWIRNPQTINPLSAMPDMGVGEADARDITAYLYTLR